MRRAAAGELYIFDNNLCFDLKMFAFHKQAWMPPEPNPLHLAPFAGTSTGAGTACAAGTVTRACTSTGRPALAEPLMAAPGPNLQRFTKCMDPENT